MDFVDDAPAGPARITGGHATACEGVEKGLPPIKEEGPSGTAVPSHAIDGSHEAMRVLAIHDFGVGPLPACVVHDGSRLEGVQGSDAAVVSRAVIPQGMPRG